MKRGVMGTFLALTCLLFSNVAANAVEATGKVQITALVESVCTLTPAAATTYMDVADFSAPGTSSISLTPYVNDTLAVIDCNSPAVVTLFSDNGAATGNTLASGTAGDYFDYTAKLSINDGSSFSCTFESALNTAHNGSEYKSCASTLQPSLSDVSLTILAIDFLLSLPLAKA